MINILGEDEDLKKEEKEKSSGNHAQSEDGYGAINQSKQKSANPFTSTVSDYYIFCL